MSISSPLSLSPSTPPPLMYCYQSGKTKINQNLQIMTAPSSPSVTKISSSFCREEICPFVFLRQTLANSMWVSTLSFKTFLSLFHAQNSSWKTLGQNWTDKTWPEPYRTWLCCIVVVLVVLVAPTYQILKYWISIERQKSVF